MVEPADGSGEASTITSVGPGVRYTPDWSPNGGRVAFIDEALQIQIANVENSARRVADILVGAPGDMQTCSPVRGPETDVSEGDYVLAVNGIPMSAGESPCAAAAHAWCS